MNGERQLEQLREAFASTDRKHVDGSCPNPESIWKAAHAELQPDEMEAVILHLQDCPSCCADWRIAAADGVGKSKPVLTRWIGMAAAAVFAMALILVVWQQPWKQPPPSYRTGGEIVIESLVDQGAGLPRDNFVLRWTPVGENPRYMLEVTRQNLDSVVRVTDLSAAEYRIPAEALKEIEDGELLAWRVEGRMMDGTVVVSAAFMTPVHSD